VQHRVQLVVRILLGLLFTFSGIAFFFTTPPPLEGDMATFFAGLAASKYFFFLLKGTETVCGLLLVSGFFVPLALVVLAPIALNIFLVHSFLAPSGVPLALAVGAAVVYLAFFSPGYSPVVKGLFVMKPGAAR
jgi:uncharacterized membrane protein YphA (DoxX/SURF4 family)